MKSKDFTKTDYYTAALLRKGDLEHLRKNESSIIFSLYCAGVAVECMLRAYIRIETKEFDSRHDLSQLFEKSKLALIISPEDKGKVTASITKIAQFWSNNLRYTSDTRMKRFIAHKIVRTKFKDINKYLKKHNNDIFEATEIIIKMGETSWKY